jgi:hypothetical protein
MRTVTGLLAGMTAALGAWAATAQPAPGTAQIDPPADPRAAIPLMAPPPQLAGAAYDSRIKASLISAQSFQGPLDGGWRLEGAGGAAYDLQLVDRNDGALQGAWRDLRRPGALDASGFVDVIARDGAALRLSFGGRTAELTPGPGGTWIGALDGQAATLARR